MIGQYTFEYGIFVGPEDWSMAKVPERAQMFQISLGLVVPLDYVEMTNLIPFPRKLEYYYQMNLPKVIKTDQTLSPICSFFKLEGTGLLYSTMKMAEEGDGVIFRLWNYSRIMQNGKLNVFKPLLSVQLVRLDESFLEEQ